MRRILLLGLLCGAQTAHAAPVRIVSLNPCLDAILLHVAPPQVIAGVSHLARDPKASVVAQQARRFPVAYPTAESILSLKPDLILASRHTDLATRKALERFKKPIALFDVPHSVAESRAQVRRIAALAGNRAAGERLIGRMDAALAAAAAASGPRVTALIYHPSGLTPGTNTLPDDLLRRTGFANMAASYGVVGWGKTGLETLIARPPSLMLVSNGGGGTSAENFLSHSALRKFRRTVRVAPLTPKLLYCGGPTIVAAAPALAAIRRGHVGRPVPGRAR
jgi:iron complex transport system substrate-binding protein